MPVSSRFNEDEFKEATEAATQFADELDQEEKLHTEAQLLEQQQTEQRAAEVKDSHSAKDASEFGLKENVKEVQNALVGGVRDTASSILTAPERIIDMASGEMAREAKEDGGYTPDWNPLGNDLNPITKTWWGGMLRGGVHFGTMAIPVLGWAGRAGKATGMVGAATRATLLSGNTLVKGASVGVVSDMFSEYSQDANGLQVLRDRFGFVDTPFTTNDADHPALKTVKNVAEGAGIGVVADFGWQAIARRRGKLKVVGKTDRHTMQKVDRLDATERAKAEETARGLVDENLRIATSQKLFNKGIDFNKLTSEQQLVQMSLVKQKDRSGRYRTWSPPGEDNLARAERKTTERTDSINNQISEKAEVEMDDPGYRGHKNISDPWQGSPNSTGSAWDVSKSLRRIDKELGSELGSTDSLITPAAAEALAENGLGAKGITPALAKRMADDPRFQALVSNLENKGRGLEEAFEDAFSRFQEVLGGRNAGELSPEEFWGPIQADVVNRFGSIESWAIEDIIAGDLIQESLFKQLRDRAIASRELIDVADINDIDGPLKYIRDNLIVGMEQTKRARFLLSEAGRQMAASRGGQKLVNQALSEIHSTTKGQVDMMLDLANQAPTDDFLRSLLEAFSMSNKISNWTDFDNYMRAKLMGTTTPQGIKQTGQMIRELQGVMIHSILSGPKTPLRAIMGTGSAVFTRPMAQTLGGAMKYASSGFTDSSMLKQSLATANAMVESIPEAYEYFFSRLNSYWAGDISTIKTRYAEYTLGDKHWDLVRFWAEDPARTAGEKAAFNITNTARSANQNGFLTYSTKLMAATDDAFTMILARMRAKEKAMIAAFDGQKSGVIPDVTPNLIKEYEARLYDEIFDPQTGAISDSMLKYARGEATLSKDLGPLGKAMDDLFSKQPALKPFYLFARTGINGLELSFKHIPGFNFLVKEFNDIARATPDDLTNVVKYGIETAEDLVNAKALQNGRLAMGTGVIFMAGQQYLTGGLTGNGPSDPATKRVWEAAGWVPRSIKLGDVWVGYDSFEPFSNILAAVADMGDNQRLMGDEWAEQGLLAHAMIISKGMVTKTYLQGVQQLFGLFSKDPKKLEKLAAALMNNAMPLAGLRNEIGKVINPHMKELNSGFADQIRNRNLFMEGIASAQLPTKYDILTGQPVRDWDPLTRMYNAISPISLNFDSSKGRQFLMNSNYDLRVTTLTAPDGTSLADHPRLRSEFQRLIGSQNLEAKLAELAKDPRVQASLVEMEYDLMSGFKQKNPMNYAHNKLINGLFQRARGLAWAQMRSDPNVMMLIRARQKEEASRYNTSRNPELGRLQLQEAKQLLEMQNR